MCIHPHSVIDIHTTAAAKKLSLDIANVNHKVYLRAKYHCENHNNNKNRFHTIMRGITGNSDSIN